MTTQHGLQRIRANQGMCVCWSAKFPLGNPAEIWSAQSKLVRCGMGNADRGHSSRHDPNGNGYPLVTAVVGSWPKPDWLSSRIHDISGWTVDREWKFQAEELKVKQDEATEWAIRQQEATGVDIVSDGEQHRDNYIYYICRRLAGFDFEDRARIVSRSGAWTWTAPRIVGPVVSTRASLVDDFRFTRNLTRRQIKVTIPGPMTISDSAKNEYYRDEVSLAMDLAAAIRKEVWALANAGCEVIQFDEPAFARYPQQVYDYGIRALEACFEGIQGITTVVHICRGYPIEGYAKANLGSYSLIAPALAESKVDQVSIEGSHRPVDPTLLEAFGEKSIIFGLVDVSKPIVETVGDIELQIRRTLEHIDPDRLAVGLDCGMVFLDPDIARAKLTNLAQAAHRVREDM